MKVDYYYETDRGSSKNTSGEQKIHNEFITNRFMQFQLNFFTNLFATSQMNLFASSQITNSLREFRSVLF